MMKIYSILLSALLLSGWAETRAQEQFTPYDDLPGIHKSYKPAFSNDLPSWAKMLYVFPVNFHEIDAGFRKYIHENPGKKSPEIRYYKMWRRALEGSIRADGTIGVPLLNGNSGQVLPPAPSVQPDAGSLSASDWNFLGPGETFWLNESGSATPPAACPWQVNVYSFDVSSTDPDILYCGTETGFVNKSVDRGLHWELSGKDYSFGGGITAVAIHPADPLTVYVAGGNQVHRTTDGGITWTPLLQAGNLFAADRLKIDPVSPQKIYAAASSGLYVTTNGGSSWTKKWSSACWDVEVKPGDPMQIFALTKSGANFSVVFSTDGGQNFQVMSSFPSSVVESSGGLLAMTPADPNQMLAVLLSANNTPYLLKGVYSGGNWTWSLKATGGTSSFPMDNGQGYFDLTLDISPVNPAIILTGTTTLFKSLNGGTSFSAVGGYYGNFPVHPDIQDSKMLPNGDTWVSTDGGMNLTTDNFGIMANYSARINGIIGSDFWGFDQGWNEDIVVGGRYHNGNTSLADFYQPKALRMGGAESPTGWVLQGKSRHVAFNDLGNGWILPATAEGKPEGRFIFSKYPNMDEYGGRRSNLVHHPNYFGRLFLGEGNGFWQSDDAGVTWELLYNFPARVRYLQISYSNPQVFYADINGAGLVRSSDGGVSWVQKPSLTSPPYGNSNWKGKLFFAISPNDENVIYACLQNGTWSADIGKVFRSADGGDTWEEWTGTLSEYMKCLVIQPSSDGTDLVYLFTNATSGKSGKVFYRKPGLADWQLFNTGYPSGMVVNMALPFFRDSRLRVGGNGGVWESPLADTLYTPIINPWTERPHYACMMDTIRFDDHSILDHTGASWHWEISPAPLWIDDPNRRDPRVVLGTPGSFDVTMTMTKNGQPFTKTIAGMVSASSCPSIYDCNNPAELPKDQWSLVYVDSEEVNDPGLAVMSFDNNPATIWHTRWSTGNDPYPHEIQIALGNKFRISRFTYLPRQDGENGRIKTFELYISEDTLDWGAPVQTGTFENSPAPKNVVINPPVTGKYFRLVALDEVNGNPWASAAEFSLTGCIEWPVGEGTPVSPQTLRAFPVPSNGQVSVSVPPGDGLVFQLVSVDGRIVRSGNVNPGTDVLKLDLSDCRPGVYVIKFNGKNGVSYRVSVLRN